MKRILTLTTLLALIVAPAAQATTPKKVNWKRIALMTIRHPIHSYKQAAFSYPTTTLGATCGTISLAAYLSGYKKTALSISGTTATLVTLAYLVPNWSRLKKLSQKKILTFTKMFTRKQETKN